MCEQLPSYYAILIPEIRYSKKLKPIEKIIYAEITALSNLKGYCFATNDYLAELYDVDSCTISRYISKLEKLGFIRCEYTKEGQIVKERHIYISTVDQTVNGTVDNSVNRTVDQTVKENNIKFNNTSINNINSSSSDDSSFVESGSDNQPTRKARRRSSASTKKDSISYKREDYQKAKEAYWNNCGILYVNKKINVSKPVLEPYIDKTLKAAFKNYGVDTVIEAIKDSINHKWLIEQGYPLKFILGPNELPNLINKTYKDKSPGSPPKNKRFNGTEIPDFLEYIGEGK